jgi:hypothetical protein
MLRPTWCTHSIELREWVPNHLRALRTCSLRRSSESVLVALTSRRYILMLIPICHFQQEIAEASDDVARKYYEETPKEDRNDTAVTAIMRHATKSRQHSFKGQFAKSLAIANPKFGDKFLQEVSSSLQNPLQCIFIPYWLMNNIPCASYRSRSTGATTRSLR